MIIARSPLRVTLGGGGTDLPSYYREHGGFLIAAAVDKYVFVTVTKPFKPGIYLKYSQIEHVNSIDEVQHRIIRETLRQFISGVPQIEITTLADIPAGTGLGSSGSFTTALLRGLHDHTKSIIHPRELAEEACHIEIDVLGEPIGKQDQYIAAFGGITCFTFKEDGSVGAEPLVIDDEARHSLEDNLLMFFTGFSRSASLILKDQDQRTRQHEATMINNLHYVKDLGLRSKAALEKSDLIGFGRLMHEHWEHKRKRSGGMSNPQIDVWYDLAMNNGAIGGKLIGAGGGGFFMFYSEDKARFATQCGNVGSSRSDSISTTKAPRRSFNDQHAASDPSGGRDRDTDAAAH
jgi:D-glycero-alpha-D-manno-heptose-7-phosphate kinase